MLVDNEQAAPKITPNLLFSNEACGMAEEAIKYYVDIFQNSEIGMMSRYAPGEAKSIKAKINYCAFQLNGVNFSGMDNGYDVDYSFNEAFSLIIKCKNQQEIDYFWEKLSAVPEAEECGWLKDKFGVSWQIVPTKMYEMLSSGTKEQIRRLTEAFLNMKKFDLEALQIAYEGKGLD